MNSLNTKLSLIATSLLLSSNLSFALEAPSELIEFTSGDTIKAGEMNDNFNYVKNLAMAAAVKDNGAIELEIDCSNDADALTGYMSQPGTEQWVSLTLIGTCAGNSNDIVQINRDNILLQGGVIDAQLKMAGKQDVVVKNTTINGKDSAPSAFIDAGSAIYLENVAFETGAQIIATGNASVVFNSSVESLHFIANMSSRYYFFSPTGTAQDILLDTGSSMGFTNLSSEHLTVLNAASFAKEGTGTLSLTSLNMGTSTGGQVSTLTVIEEVDLFANAALAIEETLSADSVYVGAGASLIGNKVETDTLNIETGAKVDMDNIGTSESPINDLILRGKSSLWAKNSVVNNLTMFDSSIDSANMAVNGNLFARKAFITATDNFSLGGIFDSGSFSYYELAYPIADMCANIDQHNSTEAWSVSSSQSFPYDCP